MNKKGLDPPPASPRQKIRNSPDQFLKIIMEFSKRKNEELNQKFWSQIFLCQTKKIYQLIAALYKIFF